MAKEPQKWVRIRPTRMQLGDPYSIRFCRLDDEEGLIVTEAHAKFYVSMDLARIVETDCAPPGSPAKEPVKAEKIKSLV